MDEALPVPTQDERLIALLAELLQAFTGFVAPLIIYLVKRDSKFVAFHSLQALFWHVAYWILTMCAMMLFFVIFIFAMIKNGQMHPTPNSAPPLTFFIMFPLLWLMFVAGWVLNLVIAIVYGIKAYQGQWAQYPIIGRLARRCIEV
jgi:uncharacterized Tic20 family protein